MKKTIYIVTQGSYSDYHICGVFSDKELAEKYKQTFSNAQLYDEMRIEEWELNPFEAEIRKGYKPFFVRMGKDGNTQEVYEDDSTSEIYGFDIDNGLYNHCFARNKRHAIKITNELRTRLIAENKWR